MRIGKLKIISVACALATLAVGWIAWGLWETDGLLAVACGLVVASTAALGWLVARSERRIRQLMTEHHRADRRFQEELQRTAATTGDSTSPLGGRHAEEFLRAFQAAATRLEHESKQQREDLTTALTSAVERQFAALAKGVNEMRREVAASANDVRTTAREVDVSRREVTILGREFGLASERFNATADDVEALSTRTRAAYDDLRRGFVEEINRRSRNEITANFRRLVDEAVSEFDSLQRLYVRYPVTNDPPALGGWAIGPGALLYMLDLVDSRGLSLVAECGPGASTIYLAEYFRRRGFGRVVSVEHDREFYDIVSSDLERRGLSSFADVRHAPLVEVAVGDRSQPWYDPSAFEGVEGIELLLVDGPPQATGDLARYPALPVLGSRLAEDAVVVLDDAHRPGEQGAIARWRDEHGWRTLPTPPGGFAVLDRSGDNSDGPEGASAGVTDADTHRIDTTSDPTDPAVPGDD